MIWSSSIDDWFSINSRPAWYPEPIDTVFRGWCQLSELRAPFAEGTFLLIPFFTKAIFFRFVQYHDFLRFLLLLVKSYVTVSTFGIYRICSGRYISKRSSEPPFTCIWKANCRCISVRKKIKLLLADRSLRLVDRKFHRQRCILVIITVAKGCWLLYYWVKRSITVNYVRKENAPRSICQHSRQCCCCTVVTCHDDYQSHPLLSCYKKITWRTASGFRVRDVEIERTECTCHCGCCWKRSRSIPMPSTDHRSLSTDHCVTLQHPIPASPSGRRKKCARRNLRSIWRNACCFGW